MRSAIFLPIALLAGAGCSPKSLPPAVHQSSGIYAEPSTFYKASDSLYEGIVAKVFATEDGFVGGCFTMVSLEDGRPEEVVYAQCAAAASTTPTVVHLVAAESIADRLRIEGVGSAIQVRVRRTEATLERAVAEDLRSTWVRLIAGAPVEAGLAVREQRRDYVFSALRPGLFRGIVSGVARNPVANTRAARLVDLAQRLAAVADAKPENRAAAVETVRRALRSL